MDESDLSPELRDFKRQKHRKRRGCSTFMAGDGSEPGTTHSEDAKQCLHLHGMKNIDGLLSPRCSSQVFRMPAQSAL